MSTSPSLRLLASLALGSLARAACQYPDGTDAAAMGYVPCAGEIASCCIQHPNGINDTCLSNGLCYSEMSKYVYQGACEDEWGSDRCPKYCLNDNTKSFERLFHCEDNEYCCSEADCCSKPSEVFDLGTPCVEEYVNRDTTSSPNTTTSTNTTTTATTTTTTTTIPLFRRSTTCTPWPLAQQPSTSSVASTSQNHVTPWQNIVRTVTIFSVVGTVIVLLIICFVVFRVRRAGVPTDRGTIDKSRGLRDFFGGVGHRIMGSSSGGAFKPVSQTTTRGSTEKLVGGDEFDDRTTMLGMTGTSSPGYFGGGRRSSPESYGDMETEVMLSPEPVAVKRFV